MTERDWFTATDDSRWLLTVEGFDPALEPTIEAVFAMVNGYLGVRAALEEGHPGARPATFIAGVFDTPAGPQAPELEAPVPELVVAPDWSRLRISVEGEELRIDTAELLEMRRVLDMRRGVLLRDWRLRDSAGRVTALRSLRFASLADRRIAGQIVSVTPENYDGTIRLEAIIDGQVTNENDTRHLEHDGVVRLDGSVLLLAHTRQPGYELAVGGYSELRDDRGETLTARRRLDTGQATRMWEWQAERGRGYTLHKIVAFATSREGKLPSEDASARIEAAAADGLEALLAAHIAAWAERWNEADIEVGDDDIQREYRFAAYHLVGSANPADEYASVGARALTGERYRGHVFWDTEIFVWPFQLYTNPAAARALLMYRYHTIAGARAKARSLGYRGALYPWEATDTGEETTPDFMVSGGERVPVLTGREEHHIAADVAYAVVQYVRATGDTAFFNDAGAEMLLAIARFWSSRAAREDDGRYHIRRVIGPDEYHETVDDNAYTNVLAAWSIRAALDAAATLRRDEPGRWAELAQRLSLDDDELADWRQVADGLVLLRDEQTGVIEQFQGYFALDPVDLRDHDPAIATFDAKVGWYAMQKTQVLKQADVVMLIFLLWDSFPPEVRAACFRYYEPRTTHDSSLSPSMHSLVAARLGDPTLAERYLRQAARIDLDFSRKGWAGASGGVHIAALGGIWQALVFGFAGMRPEDAGPRFAPNVPPAWGRVRAAVQWRGRLLRVTAGPATVEVALERGEPLEIALGDGPYQLLRPGAPLRASLG